MKKSQQVHNTDWNLAMTCPHCLAEQKSQRDAAIFKSGFVNAVRDENKWAEWSCSKCEKKFMAKYKATYHFKTLDMGFRFGFNDFNELCNTILDEYLYSTGHCNFEVSVYSDKNDIFDSDEILTVFLDRVKNTRLGHTKVSPSINTNCIEIINYDHSFKLTINKAGSSSESPRKFIIRDLGQNQQHESEANNDV